MMSSQKVTLQLLQLGCLVVMILLLPSSQMACTEAPIQQNALCPLILMKCTWSQDSHGQDSWGQHRRVGQPVKLFSCAKTWHQHPVGELAYCAYWKIFYFWWSLTKVFFLLLTDFDAEMQTAHTFITYNEGQSKSYPVWMKPFSKFRLNTPPQVSLYFSFETGHKYGFLFQKSRSY